MSSYIYKQQMFNESNAGKQCIAYLETIQNTEIERSQADELRNKYATLFYHETGLSSLKMYICNTYIPFILFKQYNITVVDDKHIDSNTYHNNTETTNNRKTAPTLADGWYIYILIMLLLSIFYERVLGWIFTTIVFVLWRLSEIDKYN